MKAFFGFGAVVGTLMYLASLALGHFGASLGATVSTHLLLGLTSALIVVSLHSLIFAIFTGSGKDTRLMTEDLDLDPAIYKKMKGYKRTVFPPALYAIFFVVLTAVAGGLASYSSSTLVHLIHPILAWFTFYYNTKTFYKEYQAIAENAELLERVNELARVKVANSDQPLEVDVLPSDIEWGTHVYAFGKFICFLGWNAWLPYVYFRYIMAWVRTPFWPFLISSLCCLAVGYYLRESYRDYNPKNRPVSVA